MDDGPSLSRVPWRTIIESEMNLANNDFVARRESREPMNYSLDIPSKSKLASMTVPGTPGQMLLPSQHRVRRKV